MSTDKKPPPPGYIAFVNETINTTLGIKESLAAIRKWAPYGPSAKPLLVKEYKRIAALAALGIAGETKGSGE